MNERIKELAEQANAWYPMGYPSGEGGDDYWQNLVIFEKEDLQKFAELIAQKCASICMEMAAKCAGLEGDGALAKDCAYWIKEDFKLK
jgi:hypothetical protein